MRTTLNLDDRLISRAAELTGRSEKAALVRMGLEALIARESSRRIASLGGTDPKASSAPRHRRSA
jgi:Arc/MetJ family transcription regulator